AITLIVTDIESNSATNTNLGGRRTLGTDINGSLLHFSGLSLGAGFSVTGATYDYYGEGDYTPMVYYNNYSFSTKYNLRKYKTIFMANYKLYGITPSLAVDENTLEYYQVYTEAYGDLEATITKVLLNNRLTAVVGAKNLLNHYEKRTYGYRGDREDYLGPHYYGRNFFVKLKFTINN
ncbi:MAG: outer membrane beta-barrel protein, partial [Bacteroidales bacterium]|nr:outer membrane beta-barrel protein [Bacteroidales bacterium]